MPESTTRIRITYIGGETIETHAFHPHPIRERVAFERHFGVSCMTSMETAYAQMAAVYRQNLEEGKVSDWPAAEAGIRDEWLMWLCWFRLRPGVLFAWCGFCITFQ